MLFYVSGAKQRSALACIVIFVLRMRVVSVQFVPEFLMIVAVTLVKKCKNKMSLARSLKDFKKCTYIF